LGSQLAVGSLATLIVPAIVLSAFVLIGNPIIVILLMNALGYNKKTGFMAGLTVAQISEFSLIFAGLGLAVGHITDEVVGLITLVGLITIGLSTYLILYSHQIYSFIQPVLNIFERNDPFREASYVAQKNKKYDIIIFGLGRFGSRIANTLCEHKDLGFLGVDFDPEVVKSWQELGRDVHYGDLEDPDLLEQLPYKEASCIVSTVSDIQHSKFLVKTLKRLDYRGRIILTALDDKDFIALQQCGAHTVLKPYEMAATNFYNSFFKKE
jgi:hypothetical protein